YLTIIAWTLFGLLVVFLTLRAFRDGGPREAYKTIGSKRIIISFILALTITLISVALVFIEPQQVGVVVSILSRDGYREQPFRSGLHWIVPLAERVNIYPIYWQTYTMSNNPLEGEKIGDDSIAARTSDGQSVFLDTSVIYRIDSNDVIRVHIDWQDRYIEQFVRPILRGIVRTEVSQFTADEVNSSKRKILEANLDELVRNAFGDKGFILDRFLLRNVAFSQEYAKAIELKQVAEQEQTQREYEAEQMRKLAEGVRDKYALEAKGKAEAILLEGKAQADVIILKGNADAEALRLINEVIKKNPDMITFRYVDKLGQAMRAMLVPSDNPFLLPLPDILSEIESESGSTPTPLVTETITSTLTITPLIGITSTPTPIPVP
ncbi:MAG TPA: prohibitin family protein, partial [Anaerolineales bacterium]|nr:prohibitin family protein [Anaerolineales bacterium]